MIMEVLTLTVANLEVFSLTRRRTAAPTLSARGKMIPDQKHCYYVDDDDYYDVDGDDDNDDDDDGDEFLPAPDEVG